MDLQRIRFLNNRLPAARFRIDRALSTATRVTAAIDGLPRGGGSGDGPVSHGVELIEEARDAYRAIQRELDGLRSQARPLIDALDDPLERQVASLRYLQGLTVRQIAYRLCYSEQHVFRVMARAEKRLQNLH